jgi:hypothetical protein
MFESFEDLFQSALGTAIEVKVTMIGGSCAKGCFFDYLELKTGHPTGVINGIIVRSPFEGTGYRFVQFFFQTRHRVSKS